MRPPEQPFGATTTKGEAYDALGAYDRNTDFGEYVHVLVEVAGIATHEELIGLLQEPARRMPRTVRSNLKTLLMPRLLAYLRDPVRLERTETYRHLLATTGSRERALRGASHAELVRISRQLESQDRGTVAERWYRETFAPRASPQVPVFRTEFPHFGEARRSIDMLDDGTLRELKNVSGGLDPGDRRQVQDLIGLINASITVGGRARTVERVVVSFVDPLGARANQRFMRTTLTANPGLDIGFEVFNIRGERMEITHDTLHLLDEPGFSRWLGLPAPTGARR
jgi:hypothetical protein